MNRKRLSRLNGPLFHLLCVVLLILMLYPVLWLVFSAFKNQKDIFEGGLLPQQWIWGNFINGWSGFGGISFSVFYKNTFITVIGATILSVFGSALTAYGFACIRFIGRGFWFSCMLITLMLPAQVLMIPQYMLFNWLGWTNTFLPLIVPYMGGYAFFIFLNVQFIRTLPQDINEAAMIDGCNRLRIFTSITLPLIKSSLVTSAIFSFYWRWEDFISPLLYLKKPKLYTVSIALKMFADPNSITDWGAMLAMSLLSLIPTFLVFLFFQRYIVEGISTSGLKG